MVFFCLSGTKLTKIIPFLLAELKGKDVIDSDLEEHHKSVLIIIMKYCLDIRILQRLLAVDFIFFTMYLIKKVFLLNGKHLVKQLFILVSVLLKAPICHC